MSPPASDFESKGSSHVKRRLSSAGAAGTPAFQSYSSLTVSLIDYSLSVHHVDLDRVL
jgi:hypothetical protein